jgi:hypothetical protein
MKSIKFSNFLIKNIVSLFLGTLVLFSCSVESVSTENSVNVESSSIKQSSNTYYSPEGVTYYKSDFYFDQPFLENELFSFPVIYSSDHFVVRDIEFYNLSEIPLFVDVSNIKTEYFGEGNYTDNPELKFYKYIVNANLNYSNLSTLSIKTVIFHTFDKVLKYDVDLNIIFDDSTEFTKSPPNLNGVYSDLLEVNKQYILSEYFFSKTDPANDYHITNIECDSAFLIYDSVYLETNNSIYENFDWTNSDHSLWKNNHLVIKLNFNVEKDVIFFNNTVRVTLFSSITGGIKFVIPDSLSESFSMRFIFSDIFYLNSSNFI